MAKWANDAGMDAALAYYAQATNILLTTSQPATRAAALTAALVNGSMTPGNGNGDFVIADGDVSGRKLTVTQQSNVNIDTSGTPTHVCLIDGSALLYVTTVSNPQGLVSGNTATIPSWKIEFRDPA